MELTKEMRECLTEKLVETALKLELTERINNETQRKALEEKKDDYLRDWRSMDEFLMQERIKVIKTALTENEIDF